LGSLLILENHIAAQIGKITQLGSNLRTLEMNL